MTKEQSEQAELKRLLARLGELMKCDDSEDAPQDHSITGDNVARLIEANISYRNAEVMNRQFLVRVHEQMTELKQKVKLVTPVLHAAMRLNDECSESVNCRSLDIITDLSKAIKEWQKG